MDFHAVVETAIDGRWQIWDATRLAPRPSLIRVSTGSELLARLRPRPI
jgi:hypothetical protein